MFLLNNKILPLDTAFTIGEGDAAIQLPANWLRLSSPMDRQAFGITEAPDPVRADDRYYWGGDINNPKALEDKLEEDGSTTKGLKSQHIAQIKQSAGSLLSQTDWMVTRNYERGVEIPANVVSYRASVVAKADELEQAVQAVTTVEDLIAIPMEWPEQ